jgi:hypothetical protein
MIETQKLRSISISPGHKEAFVQIYAHLLQELSDSEESFLTCFFNAYIILNTFQVEFLYSFLSEGLEDMEDSFRLIMEKMFENFRKQEQVMLESVISQQATKN